MYNILKWLYRLQRKSVNLIRPYSQIWFNFIQPNLRALITHHIVLNGFPTFCQLMLCEGDGIVEIGNTCSFGFKLGGFRKGGSIELQARYKDARIKIGNNIATNNNIMICAANYIEIGDDTLIGQYVTIMDHESHGIQSNERRKLGEIGKIVIGENCWIGNNVIILKNSMIGDNTIIAAGAVVSGIFPSNVIIG